MTTARFVLVLCLLACRAFAGDADAARRSLSAAREAAGNGLVDRCEEHLQAAEKQCEGLDAATRDALLKEVGDVRAACLRADLENGARRLSGELDRAVSTAKEYLDKRRWREFDGAVARIEEILGDPERKKYATEDVRKRFQEEIRALKSGAAGARVDQMLDGATEKLDDARERMGRPRDDFNMDRDILKSLDEAKFRLKDAPADDERVKALLRRIDDARAELGSQADAAGRAEAVDQAVRVWEFVKSSYGAPSSGWEGETAPPSYEEFLRNAPVTMNLEKTVKAHELAMRWLEHDAVKDVLPKYRDDAKLKPVVAEVEGLRDASAGKIAAFASKILDDAEKTGPKGGLDSASGQLRQIAHIARTHGAGSPECEKAAARSDALVAKWVEQLAAAEKARKEMIEALKKAGAELWKGWESSFGESVALDPAAILRDPDSWKGKTWKAAHPGGPGYWNAAGYGWWRDDYEFIVVINGIPVAGKFDASVLAAVQQIEKETGLDRREFDTDALVAVVEGTCKVERREVKPFTEQEMWRAGSVSAVLVRIVAFRAGPFAAAAGKESSLSKVDPKIISAGKSGAASGQETPGGLWVWILRLMSWFESLLLFVAGLAATGCGAARYVPSLSEAYARAKRPLSIAGLGLLAFGALWVLYTGVIFDFLPAASLMLAGAFLGSEFLREKGKLDDATAKKLQPLGVLVGPATVVLAVLHVALWDKWLL